MLDVEHDVAEAIEGQRVGDEAAVLATGAGRVQRRELVGVDRVAGVGQRRAGGEVRGHRGEQVAPVEGRGRRLEAVRRARDVDGLHRASEALDGQREQAVVRSDEDAVVLGGAHGHRAALAADLGVDDRQVHARREVGQRAPQHERPRAHVVAVDPVADVDDARRGRDPRHDAVAHAYELVVVAVVGQEGDHCRHRHGASLVVVAAARRPGSVSDMSDQPSTPDDAPSGLPPDEPEEAPLGVPEARPEGEDEPERGPGAMPGIPTEGEPPAAS